MKSLIRRIQKIKRASAKILPVLSGGGGGAGYFDVNSAREFRICDAYVDTRRVSKL